MVFDKRLREGIEQGQITCSIRIWLRPQVKPGGRYRMGTGGEIVVESVKQIGTLNRNASAAQLEQFPELTPELIRESGFPTAEDLLAVAKHGRGDGIYLIRFHYQRR